jgi:CelD/BcsL family acetyltransferase involved in cellulose biosynthesis
MGDVGVGSEYLGVLARREEVEAVVSALSSHLRGSWSLADLRGLREDSFSARLLAQALSGPAPDRLHRERHPCSCAPLPGDYEAYLASLPQKFRSTLRYRTNKLVKNFQVRLLRTRNEHEIEPHLARFFDMHQGRWIAEGHTGSFYTQSKRAFYDEISREFLRREWLRFYHLEVDGVLRASQFGFAFNGVLHSLQEAFDRDFHPPGVGGVGVVLRGLALKQSISEGIHAYDFLGGVADYKSRWGTQTHFIDRVRIGAPGPAGALAFAATAGVRRLKDWGRERSPAWLHRSRERLRSWRRIRHARQIAARLGGGEG